MFNPSLELCQFRNPLQSLLQRLNITLYLLPVTLTLRHLRLLQSLIDSMKNLALSCLEPRELLCHPRLNVQFQLFLTCAVRLRRLRERRYQVV